MIIIQNGRIVSIEVEEDKASCYKVIIPKETYRSYVRDGEYELKCENEGYIFRCTVSPFSDHSGLNNGISGHHPTKGEAIDRIVSGPDSIYGEFKVLYNGIEIPKRKSSREIHKLEVNGINLIMLE